MLASFYADFPSVQLVCETLQHVCLSSFKGGELEILL